MRLSSNPKLATIAKTLAAMSLAGSMLALSACADETGGSPTASPAASTTPSASPSPSKAKITPAKDLSKITVEGDFGKAPKVKVPTPWGIAATQTKVLKPGNGAVIKEGVVEVNYQGVNGRTGETFDESFTGGKAIAFNLDQVVPGFKKGLVGQRVGSRVLIAMTGPDGYDASGGNPDAGIELGDSLLFVVDIVSAQLTGPEGTTVKPRAGLPTVVDKDGTPVVTLPKGNPPAKLEVQPLIAGKGRKVGATDQVTIHYQWLTWSDGKVVEQNFGKPAESTPLAGLIPGLQKALTGQTVGSRVLVVVPPADGYPNGNESPKVGKDDTSVFVVDILFSEAGQ